MARKKPAPRKAARRPGRTKGKVPVVTPAVLARIEDLHLRGFSLRKIGILCQLDPRTVYNHIENTLRPKWKDAAVTRLEDDLARVQLLEQVAWQAWEDSQKPETRKTTKFFLPDPEKTTKKTKPAAKQATRKTVSAKLKADGADREIVERSIVKITKVGAVAYLEIVKWCIEFRAKLGGYFDKDTAGASGESKAVLEVVVKTPEQWRQMIDFDTYSRSLTIDKENAIEVEAQ